jgi:DNA-binding phage protein
MQPTTKTTPYDVTDYLHTEDDIAAYLEACKQDAPGDGSLLRAALGNVARARVRWQQLPATPTDPDSPHTTLADWHGAAMKQNGVAVGMVASLPDFDITDYLKTEADMATYLQICEEDDPGDDGLMRAALDDVARARVRWLQPPATTAQPAPGAAD